jgi:hypothetical protein
VFRDAWARVTRALEALADDEPEVAFQILDDLVHDLWKLIEELERR